MLNRIKALFSDLDESAEPAQTFHDKHIAAACLMVEAAELDGYFDEDEHKAIGETLVRQFGLSEEEAGELLAEARQRQDESNHLLRFTRAVKDHFDEDERIAIIEMIWQVVLADGVVHKYEDNLVRRVAGLIYVSDRDRGSARKRAESRLAESSSGDDPGK